MFESIREKFLQYYPDEDLKKWFDPLVLSYPQNGSGSDSVLTPALTVKFPHRLFADWWSTKHRDNFESTLARCLGSHAYIDYSCQGSLVAPRKHIAEAEAIQSIEAGADKEPEHSFANFIFNRKNQFPHSAAQNFTRPGNRHILLFFGPSGCGKTHILQAIYNETSTNVHQKSIFINILVELETFFSNAFKNGQSPLLYFRHFKYILIDDLDMVASRPDLQEQLAILIEYAKDSGINLAFTLRQKPCDTALISEKLRSLLEACLVLELKKPDLDVRRQYIEYTANALNLKLKKDDALALARMYSGFRQIYGALVKVSSFLVLSPQAAEAKLADILQTNISESQKSIGPDHIINAVAEYFNISPSDITGKKRKQNIVFARHLSMYLCREILNAQLGHIGACFSDRDHSSVLYSVNKIKSMIISDKDTHNSVTEIKNILMK